MNSNEEKTLEIHPQRGLHEVDTLIHEPNDESKLDDYSTRETWQSCCLRTDPHAIAYFGQLSISILILTFSFIQLMRANGECNQSSPYIGLVSFLMGKLLSSVVGSGK